MAILRVPQSFLSVSLAAASARPGDTILVDPGYSRAETVTLSVPGLRIDADAPTRLNVVLGTGVGSVTLAGDADITVRAASTGSTIVANAGDNFLVGGLAGDSLYGGAGVDNLTGGAGNDLLNGGADFDYADYGDAGGSVVVNLATGRSSGAAGFDTLRNIEAVRGSSFNDTLVGDSQTNVLEGRGGQDYLNGAGGFDFAVYRDAAGGIRADLATGLVTGADGTDTLRNIEAVEGTRFADTLLGNALSNTLIGNGGNDVLNGRQGFDRASYLRAKGSVFVDLAAGRATGADGTDVLVGIEGVEGSQYADRIFGDAQDNALEGRRGNDRIDGRGGINTAVYVNAIGSVVVNLLTGRSSGAEGADTLANIQNVQGSAFADKLYGNAGDNVLEGRRGNDLLVGGDGTDTASYANAAGAVSVNLETGKSGGADGADTLQSIERVIGSRFNDTLVGDSGANRLVGNAGNDRIYGGLGADAMLGGLGNDTYRVDNAGDVVTEGAGQGIDTVQSTIDYTLGNNVENLTLIGTEAVSGYGNALANTIVGTNEFNYLFGADGNDQIFGGGGDDYLFGEDGSDVVEGGAGDDVLFGDVADDSEGYYPTSSPAPGNDKLYGGAGVDVLYGQDGADLLSGDDGNDYLYGGAGADDLRGGAGNDTLDGGPGADSLDGGGGIDTVEYFGSDTAVVVNLATGLGSGGSAAGDRLTSIENVAGSYYGDTLIGNAADNVIDVGGRIFNFSFATAEAGDTLQGGGGRDIFDVAFAAPLTTWSATGDYAVINLTPALLAPFTRITDLDLGGGTAATSVDRLRDFVDFPNAVEVVSATPTDLASVGPNFAQAVANLFGSEGDLEVVTDGQSKAGLYAWNGEVFLISQSQSFGFDSYTMLRVTGFVGTLDASDFVV